MAKITYLGPNDPLPDGRHIAVIIHRDHMGAEKGYFYDSVDRDSGGAVAFDWRMPEAIKRAERLANDKGVDEIVVLARRS